MKRRVLSSVLLFGLVVMAAPAQQPLQGAIPDWPAPAFWTPDHQKAVDVPGEKAGADAPLTSPLPFIGVSPCRIVDTRLPAGPHGGPSLPASQPQNFVLHAGPCSGIPFFVGAYSLNITATNTQGPGFIAIFPQDGPTPSVSTLNYLAGQTVSNAAVVPAGSQASPGRT